MLVYDFFYQLFHYINSIDFYDFRWLTCNLDKPVAIGKIYAHERKKELYETCIIRDLDPNRTTAKQSKSVPNHFKYKKGMEWNYKQLKLKQDLNECI